MKTSMLFAPSALSVILGVIAQIFTETSNEFGVSSLALGLLIVAVMLMMGALQLEEYLLKQKYGIE